MTDKAYTYDDGAVRESLLDIITNISPTDTPLVSGIGTSTAGQILHQWTKESLETTDTDQSEAGVEGADPTDSHTSPTKLFNYCQIFIGSYKVTGTEQASDKAGGQDRLGREAIKKMKKLKNDMEAAAIRGTIACGTGSAARNMKGIKAFFTGNNITSQSGTSLTESILNDYLQSVWDDGTTVTGIYAPMYLKRKISGFTAGSTKNVNAEDKRLINAVDVYQSDVAPMAKLFAERYITVTGDTNYDLLGIDEDLFRIAYLREPKTEPLAKTGDAEREQVVWEATLECLNDNAGFYTQAIL